MLRVGLTGGLGSGKSTVAAFFRECGVHVLEADGIARSMMQPGQDVYRSIVETFGPSVVRPDATLDRARLAALAFANGRLAQLNRIVHPPVIAEQERQTDRIFALDPFAVAMVESALIFEAEAGGSAPGWRRRFDRIVLVTAPDDLKIERFLARILPPDADPARRAAAERDARRRLAAQIPDSVKIPQCDFILDNSGSLASARSQARTIAAELLRLARV